MKQHRPSAAQPDRTAAPKGQGNAARGTGQEQAAIVVVGRDADVRKALGEELSGRYGADYRIVGRGLFYGAGVSEAPAMRGQKVYVIGGGNSAGQAALHLAKWAAQVTVLVRSPSLTESMSDYLIREIDAVPNVEVRYDVQVVGGSGTDHLKSLVLEDTKTRVRRSVPADGLFVLIGSEPRTGWLGDNLARDRWGFILTGPDLLDDPGAQWDADRQPLLLETSLPGVFAAGDVRHGSVKRVASAVGDGAITIPLVHRYLEGLAVPEAATR